MMRKLFVFVLLMFQVIFGTKAQNQGIRFEQIVEWKKVIEKAKKEKKLIFVDCYTSWCGPCKMLARDVFTQDTVADYFNQYFVCVKFDMEKDTDGVILKKQFNIKAFPTLVFVDPDTQEVVHRMVGAGPADWLIAGAKMANNPQNNLSAMIKRYTGGERNPEFLSDYLEALSVAYMTDELEKVATEYLNSLSVGQLATEENWELINKYINDPLSEPLKQVMNNRKKFYAIAGEVAVDDKLDNVINHTVLEIGNWHPGMQQTFDEKRYTDLVNYLSSVDYPAAPAALAQLYTAEYIRKGDFRGLLDKMKEVLSGNLLLEGMEKIYFQNNIEALTFCEDKALVEEGIAWIDKECLNTSEYFEKAGLMNSKARLQIKIGDIIGADKTKMEEEKYTKEGEKQSGGKIMRAIRMN